MKNRYLTMTDVCESMHISVGTGRNRLSSGYPMPPYVKIGRKLLFPENLFEDWMESFLYKSSEVGCLNDLQ